jgi:hypothetical protein
MPVLSAPSLVRPLKPLRPLPDQPFPLRSTTTISSVRHRPATRAQLARPARHLVQVAADVDGVHHSHHAIQQHPVCGETRSTLFVSTCIDAGVRKRVVAPGGVPAKHKLYSLPSATTATAAAAPRRTHPPPAHALAGLRAWPNAKTPKPTAHRQPLTGNCGPQDPLVRQGLVHVKGADDGAGVGQA